MHAAPRVPLSLQVAIAVHGGGMSLPVGFLITGMLLSPLAPAVADDLGVLGIVGDPLAMVIGTPLPLALRLAADVLLRMELRGRERLMAITAAAQQNISSEERLERSF
jgi:hypothetical protein